MRRLRTATPILGLILILALVGACAKSPLGKAIQSADFQKKLVEAVAVEFIKLHLKGDPRITDAVYTQGKATYQKYYSAQLALATALASWKTVSSVSNEARLTSALTEVTKDINVYLSFVGQFVDLDAVKKKVSAGPGQSVVAFEKLQLQVLLAESMSDTLFIAAGYPASWR